MVLKSLGSRGVSTNQKAEIVGTCSHCKRVLFEGTLLEYDQWRNETSHCFVCGRYISPERSDDKFVLGCQATEPAKLPADVPF
jgi:hypothetical protein